jgi:hypothetical protein
MIPSDDERRVLLVIYQLLMQGLLYSILDFHDLFKDQRSGENSLFEKTFVTVFPDPPELPPNMPAIVPILAKISGATPPTTPLATLNSEYPRLATVAEESAMWYVLLAELLLELAGALSPNNSTS